MQARTVQSRPDRDVTEPITIQVTQVGDGPSELIVAGFADEDQQRGHGCDGATLVHEHGAGCVAATIVVRGSDDDLGHAVARHVAERHRLAKPIVLGFSFEPGPGCRREGGATEKHVHGTCGRQVSCCAQRSAHDEIVLVIPVDVPSAREAFAEVLVVAQAVETHEGQGFGRLPSAKDEDGAGGGVGVHEEEARSDGDITDAVGVQIARSGQRPAKLIVRAHSRQRVGLRPTGRPGAIQRCRCHARREQQDRPGASRSPACGGRLAPYAHEPEREDRDHTENDEHDPRSPGALGPRSLPHVAHRRVGGLWTPIATHDAVVLFGIVVVACRIIGRIRTLPIALAWNRIVVVLPPFVRPSEDDPADRGARDDFLPTFGDHARLALFAGFERIDPELGDDEGASLRDGRQHLA